MPAMSLAEYLILKEEYRTLITSFEYAYAMGHGCSYTPDPRLKQYRDRADDLLAKIKQAEKDAFDPDLDKSL